MAAVVLQPFLVLAVGALVPGSLCVGSFVYHPVFGKRGFARRPLPWARGA